jgi:hypothetical protein
VPSLQIQIFPHSTPRTHTHTTMTRRRRLRRLDTHAPIVQLRVIDKARKNLPSPSPSPPPPTQHHQQPPSHPHAQQHDSSGPLDTSMLTPASFGTGPFLQNLYYFMFASLAKPDDDTELLWMKVRSFVHNILLYSFTSFPVPTPGWQDHTQTTTTCTHARTQTMRRHSTRRHACALI